MSTSNFELRSAPGYRAVRSSEIVRSIASVMLGLFLIFTLLFPVAFVNKAIFVGLFCLLLIAPLVSKGRVRFRTLSPLVILTIFLYGYAHAFVGPTDEGLSNQLMLSVALLMLIYVIDWYAIDLEYLIKLASLVLCAFTGFSIYAVLVVPDSTLGAFFIDYFNEYTNQLSGSRSFSDSDVFMFRLGPVPFLFLPFCLFLDSFIEKRRMRDLVALLIISASILISASRSLILVCMLVSAYLVIRRMKPVNQVIMVCIGTVLGTLLVAYLVATTSIFSLTETSNSIKMGHVISFFEHMTPARLFFGDGLAATYFSLGANGVIPQTEITLLDSIRFFGLPLTVVLYAAMVFPVLDARSYAGENLKILCLFLFYLFISLTNPVLFLSYGLIVVIWYWARILAVRA